MPTTVTPTVTFDFTPLRIIRRKRGISQAQLALSAGMSWDTVHRIESNRNIPSLWRAMALARALGVPVQSLFTVIG